MGLERHFLGCAIGAVENLEDVDLDERRTVAAIEYAFQEGTFVPVQIVIHGADIDVRGGLGHLGEQTKTNSCQQTFHRPVPRRMDVQ
ncbi:hypothetical protein D3C73_1186010 [compost metagenome]